jgi:hypothetical protein
MKRMMVAHELLERDHEKLRGAIVAHQRGWAELEIALSALLYEVLRVEPRSSHVAYALYYSPTSLEARTELVHNALIQLIAENPGLTAIAPLWASTYRKIRRARTIRNAVAHGTPHTLSINSKSYARLTSPAFDVIRVGRTASKGQIPGIAAQDLVDAVTRVARLMECVDDTNRAIVAFRDNPSAFEEHLRSLASRLKNGGSGSSMED